MKFKKAVKKIKKLVRESENPFVEECVSVFESRGLDGGMSIKVNFSGVCSYGAIVDYQVHIENEWYENFPSIIGYVYEQLEDILDLDSIDQLIDIAVPILSSVSIGRIAHVLSIDVEQECIWWVNGYSSGQIKNISAMQIAKLANRDANAAREYDCQLRKERQLVSDKIAKACYRDGFGSGFEFALQNEDPGRKKIEEFSRQSLKDIKASEGGQ